MSNDLLYELEVYFEVCSMYIEVEVCVYMYVGLLYIGLCSKW